MKPGEIYLANIPGVGPHPVVVVSREELNRGRKIVAVVFTSAKFGTRSQLPNCVPFRAGQFGLTVDCVAQCETVAPIPKDALDLKRGVLGVLTDQVLRDVIRAIGNVLDANCEPI